MDHSPRVIIIAIMILLAASLAPAIAQMQVFTIQVNLFERLRLITRDDAAYLREEAEVIRELLRE